MAGSEDATSFPPPNSAFVRSLASADAAALAAPSPPPKPTSPTSTTKSGSYSASPPSLKGSALAGTSVGLLKTLIRHPLDTLTVRLQTTSNDVGSAPPPPLARNPLSLYAGVLPSGVCSVLTGPVFFSCKDYAAQALRSVEAVPPALVVPLAVLAATPVYWGARTPLETIKARVQASSAGSTLLDVSRTGLWDGYIPNCLYGYPADLVKFGLYEMLKPSFSPLISGSLSTMVAQGITTPLDADRNRIMTDKGYEGGRWKGLWLRVAKGGVGGAVQFIVYEYVIANWG